MNTPDGPKTRPQPLGSARRTFSTLDDATGPEVTERPAAPTPAAAPVASPRSPAKGPENGARPRQRAAAAEPSTDRPRYLELERKETRLREEQVSELTRLARQLARAARRSRPAGAPGERITDNTLIRVAVDLLLSRADRLSGTTEDELRRSVGL